MTTLLITHTRRPQSPHAARPSGAAGSAARAGAGVRGGAVPAAQARRGAERAARNHRAVPPDGLREALREATPKQGIVCDRRRHLDVAGQLRGRGARGRRRDPRGRRGGRQARRQRLRLHAAARPSHRDRPRHGLLPVQHRRDRRALRAGPSRPRPRRGDRLRRASRQRHAGHLLGRRHGDVLLDPPDAALSRHRRGIRERRARHHRQRAAFRRRRRRAVPRGVREPHPAAAARLRPRAGRDLGRLRRPQARPARQPAARRKRFRLGDAAS